MRRVHEQIKIYSPSLNYPTFHFLLILDHRVVGLSLEKFNIEVQRPQSGSVLKSLF